MGISPPGNSSIFSILHNPSTDQPNKAQRLLFNLHSITSLLSTDSTVTDIVYLPTSMCQPVTEQRMIMINQLRTG